MTAEPERTCIVTRQVKPKEELLRFVVGPDDQLVPDLAHKLPGRGVYVTCSKLSLLDALSKRSFSKSVGQQVRIPDDFLNKLQQLMEQRVGEALSFARKGGLVITGFEKVEEALKKGSVAALIHASDAGGDGKKKLAAIVKAISFLNSPATGELKATVPTYDQLSRELLGSVVGRENAVHVAVLHGPAAAFFLDEARRFALFLE